MRPSVSSAWRSAAAAILLDCATWRLISPIEDVISSVAEATDATLDEACSDTAMAGAGSEPGDVRGSRECRSGRLLVR